MWRPRPRPDAGRSIRCRSRRSSSAATKVERVRPRPVRFNACASTLSRKPSAARLPRHVRGGQSDDTHRRALRYSSRAAWRLIRNGETWQRDEGAIHQDLRQARGLVRRERSWHEQGRVPFGLPPAPSRSPPCAHHPSRSSARIAGSSASVRRTMPGPCVEAFAIEIHGRRRANRPR